MDQVFNELSLSASLPDNYAAYDALLSLKKASDRLMGFGLSAHIRVTEDFAVRRITPDCTIHEYLRRSVGGKEKTLQQLLLSRFTDAPYVEKLCLDAGMTVLEEYTIDQDICKGLALASLWDIPALSLAGDSRFVPPFVTLVHNSLHEDAIEVFEEECRVGLICREEDVSFHEEDIKDRLSVSISTGEELLEYARERLTSLAFSSTAEDQLANMQRGYFLLPRIRTILETLHNSMQEAVGRQQAFLPQGFRYTPAESDTATQGKNRQKHTFRFVESDTQGNTITLDLLCEAHMYITDGDRIYFTSDYGKKIVYIGHIGEHLPGKKFG